jgi:hypothetical protein
MLDFQGRSPLKERESLIWTEILFFLQQQLTLFPVGKVIYYLVVPLVINYAFIIFKKVGRLNRFNTRNSDFFALKQFQITLGGIHLQSATINMITLNNYQKYVMECRFVNRLQTIGAFRCTNKKVVIFFCVDVYVSLEWSRHCSHSPNCIRN